MVDSESKGTYFRDVINYADITDVGYYDIKCQLGNSVDMGYVAAAPPIDGSLKWFKPNEGSRIFFNGDSDWGTQNAGVVARTRSDIVVESGYRDVFNAAGQLVWSAVMAAKIPRIVGFFDIPANYPLDSTVYSQNIGANTFILVSALSYGNINDDGGSSTGYSGMYFRFSGGVLQCQWVSKLQNTWASSLGPYGVRIPYAILPNIS
ncbi:hypothetical protein LU196_13230 [Pantoea sp. Mb-10]|uniref:hypothetical protein n=1 Tax=unclassified Pantoea TaxID=2630326 RepID=UPI001E3FB880|nr:MULTISPECIES: hypothetical protein [unclassified Pantoea]MCE0491003.1 hypothetical protein [Pantoea sp. Mb-10]MCE0499838.1 hypothetical protein [Pantoea sp. Pb-8]